LRQTKRGKEWQAVAWARDANFEIDAEDRKQFLCEYGRHEKTLRDMLREAGVKGVCDANYPADLQTNFPGRCRNGFTARLPKRVCR
jgi:hypothetical protein